MLAPGVLLQNRYRIVRRIGQGGMGAVYEAQHEELGHKVALKETSHTDDEMLRKAFKREARLLAGLRHPALPGVSDYFTEGDGLFLVMEYVPGDDLAELLKRRGSAFPIDDVLRWAGQLLDVLNYLHTYDPPIIHRDIKPSNIKLTSDDRIVLVDFGLAKGTVGASTSIVTSRSVIGFTLSYAPLEQVLKADPSRIEHLSLIDADRFESILRTGADPRSDLYSLGATLYHLLTRKLPTQAPMRAMSIWSGRPDPLLPVNEVNSGVSPSISAVLMQALALHIEERPVTAAEMSRMLREASQLQATASSSEDQAPIELLSTDVELPPTLVDGLRSPVVTLPDSSSSSSAPRPIDSEQPSEKKDEVIPEQQDIAPEMTPPEPAKAAVKRGTRKKWDRENVYVSIILLIFISIIAIVYVRQRQASSVSQVNQTWARMRDITTDQGDVFSIAFSPDSKTLASGGSDETVKLWDAQTGGLKRTFTGHLDWIRSVTFSSDGKLLASGADDKLVKIWDAQTGVVKRTITGYPDWVRSVAFSPDNKRIAIGGNDRAIAISSPLSGGLYTRLSGHEGSIFSVAFSPDSKTLASGGSDKTVKLWDTQTGGLKQTLSTGSPVYSVAFSPDGKILAGTDNNGIIRLWDVQTGEIQRMLKENEGMEIYSVAFSPDGNTLAVAYENKTVGLWDWRTDIRQQPLTGLSKRIASVTFSPDGKMLAGGSQDGTIRLWAIAHQFPPEPGTLSTTIRANWFLLALVISAIIALLVWKARKHLAFRKTKTP